MKFEKSKDKRQKVFSSSRDRSLSEELVGPFAFYLQACKTRGSLPIAALSEQLSRFSSDAAPVVSLNLKGVDLSGSRDLGALCDLLAAVAPECTSLNLGECSLGDKGFSAIVDRLGAQCALERLDVSFNGIESVRPLVRLFAASRLAVLDLTGNFLTLPAAEELAAGLAGATGLLLLRVGDSELDNRALSVLLGGVEACPSLKNLALSDNKLDARAGQIVAGCVERHPSLTTLDLSYNNLGDHGVAAVAGALKGNKVLMGLVLWGNSIQQLGAVSIAHALKANTTLRSLDIGLNRIGTEGVQALQEALGVNTSLTHLGLAECGLQDEGAVAVAEALSVKCPLVSIDLRGNRVAVAGVMALNAAVKLNARLTRMELYHKTDTAQRDALEVTLWEALQQKLQDNATNTAMK